MANPFSKITAKKKKLAPVAPSQTAASTALGVNQSKEIIKKNPVPNKETPTSDQNIVFNRNGTVNLNGQTLSRDDYKALLELQGGNVPQRGLNNPASAVAVQQALLKQEEIRAAKLTPEQQASQAATPPPAPLGQIGEAPGFSALDAGKVLGGLTGGAAIGAGVGTSILPGIGTVLGGAIGAIGGAASAFYLSQSGERKQATKTGFTKFSLATGKFDQLMNSANARLISANQARAYRDAEYNRVLQAEQEVKNAGAGAFGRKLAKNDDELAKIQDWKNNFALWNIQFELSLANPNPSNIIMPIGVADQPEETGLFQ